MQPEYEPFLSTSVASTLLTRFSRTHEKRGITVVAGNPGIGKTTAVERFRELNPGRVAVIDLGEGPKGGHSSTSALQFAIEAVSKLLRQYGGTASGSHLELRRRFYEFASDWADLTQRDLSAGVRRDQIARCTIIFDEAQHLSRGGIEALRSINDASRTGGFSPFPIGLIFVGNHEFALKSSNTRPSVLTEAVQDRILYNVALDYDHVTDGDLELYLESRAEFGVGALRLALNYFKTGHVSRSFRSADRLLDRLAAEVGGDPVTTATVRHVLALA